MIQSRLGLLMVALAPMSGEASCPRRGVDADNKTSPGAQTKLRVILLETGALYIP